MRRFGRTFFSVTLATVLAVALGSCALSRNQLATDRSGDLERDDFRRMLAARPLPEEAKAPIPELESVVAMPDTLKNKMPIVSVSVNQTVPLRDVMFELAQQAKIDIELDPQIRGSVIFTARQRPFDEVIGRICAMAGLRWYFDRDVLRVELDRPYLRTYKMDYLNVSRAIESKINTNISVVSGEGADVGSSAKVETKVETDFWGSIEQNIEQILASTDTRVALATLADPEAQPRMGLTPAVDPATAAAGQEGGAIPPVAPGGEPVQMTTNANGIPSGPPVLSVQFPTAPTDPPIPNPPSTFSVNKDNGLINVFATEQQQKEIGRYLSEVHRNATAQVLIEAKVLEVALSDEYNTGINWNEAGEIDLTGLVSLSGSFERPAFNPSLSGGAFTAKLQPGRDLEMAVSALSRFGTVRALSSPRVTVLNHQTAVLNMAQNNVFFEVDVTVETDDDTGDRTVSVDSNAKSVPEGVMLNVVPTVNLDTNEISMVVRPTVTRIINTVEDPGVAIALATADVPDLDELLENVTNEVPEVSIQEVDSLVKMQSGDVMVLGGLMQDRTATEEVGIPVLSDVPVLGNVFKNHKDKITKSELVIFLKARIIPGSGVEVLDTELINKFGRDRRPWHVN